MSRLNKALCLTTVLASALILHAQSKIKPADPTRDAGSAALEKNIHQPLPEQYIWNTAADPKATETKRLALADQTEHRYFRDSFQVASVPAAATLYVAGPRWEKVWINGHLADEVANDPARFVSMTVFATDITRFLQRGKNVIALEVVRGSGHKTFSTSALIHQQNEGQIVVAKILPAPQGVLAPSLTISDTSWKASLAAAPGWESPSFNDTAWQKAKSIGSIESNIEFYQANADAGLYDWPGYDGISPFLAHLPIAAERIVSSYEGRSHFTNSEALTGGASSFTLDYKPDPSSLAPSMLLDFGRELTGRIAIESASGEPIHLTVQYGESEKEATESPFLGVDGLTVGPHAIAYGPKSAFRFVKIQFLGGPAQMAFKSIHVDDIFYPVQYQGSFESSDPKLNRIWEVGAYTAHLCMQDGLWDSAKRDRARWSGDNDVTARTIDDVFLDHALLEETMDSLIGDAPVTRHVNGIPGYSSYWFTQLSEYSRHTGSKEFLTHTHDRALQLLALIDTEFNEQNLYANTTKSWPFVDWSPELNSDSPEARRAIVFEFYRAYREAAWLLREEGDTANADKYDQRSAAIKAAADKYLLDPTTGTYGPRWQTNAMAVLSGIAGPEHYDAIWTNVLSKVGHQPYSGLIVTPYYNYYIVAAMAQMGHRKEALDWIRTYWGGMLAEGATSFWEGYDPTWYKGNFHAALQADNVSGYFVTLAHGWSSGPTPWLMEEVLGIHATGPGFSTVDIRPDLIGLTYARGAEPTPRGLLKVDATPQRIIVDIPEGVTANISVPVANASGQVFVNGSAQPAKLNADSGRAEVTLSQAGHYTLESR